MRFSGIYQRIIAGCFCILAGLNPVNSYRSHESLINLSNTEIQHKVSTEKLFFSYFKNKGFSNGKIEIPELQIEVNLKENQFFKKEEDIVDVCERIKEIRKQFGLPDPNPKCVLGYGWCGFLHAECNGKTAYGYIILIREDLNEVSRVYTIGHESGHFLWYIHQKSAVYQKFKNPKYIQSKILTNCEFAILCGWVAVKIAGYSLNDCLIMNIENPELEKKSDFLKNLVRNYLMKKSDKENNAEEGTRTPTS